MIKQIEINIDYILLLVKKYHDSNIKVSVDKSKIFVDDVAITHKTLSGEVVKEYIL